MIIRLIPFLCFILTLVSCAHTMPLTPRQQTAKHITSAYVRVHTSVSYEIKRCNPNDLTQCREIGLAITGPAGIGSGGIIAHSDSSSAILTATHVVSDFGARPSSNQSAIQGIIRAYAGITGTPLSLAKQEFRRGILKAEGIETSLTIAASNGIEYKVNSIDCHSTYDICVITTSSKIESTPTLSVSHRPPVIGDKIHCAQGPFGYAIPGMMVPLFEGIYSGSTPPYRGTLAQDYYTFPVAPGSSGSLILNQQGEIMGVVSMFMSGPFCADGLGCSSMSSGITVSVPFSIVHQFVVDFISSYDREES